MKKILSFVALLVISTSIFTGCGNKAKETTTQNTSTTQSSTTQNSTAQSSTSKTNAQSSDAKKIPELSGEVSSINGTEVTIKVIEIPSMNKDNGTKPADGQNKDQAPPADNQNKDKTPPTDGQKPKMETKYTGETKTLKIADDITITTLVKDEKSGTEKGMTEKNISKSDIKVGDKLDIWYTDSNKTTISKINVLSLKRN